VSFLRSKAFPFLKPVAFMRRRKEKPCQEFHFLGASLLGTGIFHLGWNQHDKQNLLILPLILSPTKLHFHG